MLALPYRFPDVSALPSFVNATTMGSRRKEDHTARSHVDATTVNVVATNPGGTFVQSGGSDAACLNSN
jgi:hypothetical protein